MSDLKVAVGGIRVSAKARPASSAHAENAAGFHAWFVGIAFAVYSGGFLPALRNYLGEVALAPGSQDPPTTVAQSAVLLILLVGYALNWRRIVPTFRYGLPLFALLALIMVSATWSQFPENTLRRGLALTSCCLWGFYAIALVGLGRTLRVLGIVMMLIAAANIAVALALPQVGLDVAPYEGALRGVFAQKNQLGSIMGLGSIFFVYAIYARKRRLTSTLMIFLIAAETWVSKSATSEICVALMLLAPAVAMVGRQGPGRKAIVCYVLIVGLLCLGGLSFYAPDQVFDLIGKDETLTGRGPIWEAAWQAVRARPLLGYGYNGFWNANAALTQDIWKSVGWNAPNGHNGYLDTVLQLGFVGLGLVMFIVWRIAASAIREWASSDRPEAFCMVLFLAYYLIQNITETDILEADSYTALLSLFLVALGLWRAEHARLRAAAREASRPRPPRLSQPAEPRPGLRLASPKRGSPAARPQQSAE